MINLHFNIYNPVNSTHRYTEDTFTTKFFIFKPRTKSEVVTDTVNSYITANIMTGTYYHIYRSNSKQPLTEEQLKQLIMSNFKWAPTTRTAQNYNFTLSQYLAVTHANNFITSTKLFSNLENFTKNKFGKLNFLTPSYYKNYINTTSNINSSRATETIMVIKCKTMEVYEILETLSKNQHLLPEGNYKYALGFLSSILHRKLSSNVHS